MYTRYIIGKCLQMFSDSNICVAYQIQYDMQIKAIYIIKYCHISFTLQVLFYFHIIR